ncbi:hypothetical protein [Vibrio gazogenes]|uniref:Uncharacterized protein n=1 Tax=Vibrio gazogenes DSM 21264 = NBRC 103151 TaxID=1123492 RepID=A0A1M4TGB6_VIBGA|nr:hypothetical protein [Vibrio gazogenes]USP16089.1 hypothetical protein MKS89_17030 [Vibrio gazogenes]SHE43513.1 hypothetical protein SAMN02745781_00310 [Vibrio gazogenes DSM 21264] [Vibrio gazogenes DSM 21264 = NBRC 103151]SJN54230.1 hypothetical protein BQ6471_00894 [Vibrio gazogenes]
MAEDIAFKIQLGLVLPKLEEQLASSLTSIIEEVMAHLKKGTLAEEEGPTTEDVKDLILKDLEIFLDNAILPAIAAKNQPAQAPEAAAAEPSPEEAPAEA